MLRFLTLAACAASASGFFAPAVPTPTVSRCASASMKVYDWKVRGVEAAPIETLDLSNLAVSPGSHKSKTRKGRGISAGQGATCGFGTRGQKSRSGRSTRPGFEGGQIPLYRRLPKFVGRPMGPGHSKTLYGIVKLNVLNSCAEGSTVDYESLQDAKLVSKSKCVLPYAIAYNTSFPRTAARLMFMFVYAHRLSPIHPHHVLCFANPRVRFALKKVVGGPEAFTAKGLTVKAHAFTTSARGAIESNGGTCVVLPKTAPKEAPAAEE